MIPCRAYTPIIAGRSIIQVLAARLGITTVIGTDVPVIAIKRGARDTFGGNAALRSRTYISIRAVAVTVAFTARNRRVETAILRVAGIGGAAIAIITGDGIPRLTYPIGATVPCGADTAVIAG